MKKRNPNVVKRIVLLLIAHLCIGMCVMAQVQNDKLRGVPTVDGDAATEFLMLTHLTDSASNSDGTMPSITDTGIENLKAGAYLEYQITSSTGASFAVNLLLEAQREDALLNVGIYKTETEAWPANGFGDTIRIAHNPNVGRQEWYISLTHLEASVTYTLRLNMLKSDNNNGVCSINGLNVQEIFSSFEPAILSDIQVNEVSIPSFAPSTTLYNIFMEDGEWINSIEGTAGENAEVEVVEIFNYPNKAASYIITVRSDFGFVSDYKLNIRSSVIQNIQPDKLRLVPTVEGDPDSEFLMFTHLTDSAKSITGQVPSITNEKVEYIKHGAYLEYQIVSPVGSIFLVNVTVGTEIDNAQLNVGYYKTQTEFWPQEGMGDTVNIVNNDDWGSADSYYFPIELEEGVSYTMRVNFINNVESGWVCNMYGIQVNELCCNYDYSLRDLRVNDETIFDFYSDKKEYNVAIPIEINAVTIDAEANSNWFLDEITGLGSIDISAYETIDTVRMIFFNGINNDYILNIYKPIEITDGVQLSLGADLFNESGVLAADSLITNFNDGDYIEYYIYSKTDKEVNLRVNATNGNRDNIYSDMYVVTYAYSSDWLPSEIIEKTIARKEMDKWTAEYAMEEDFTISLKANEPVILRLGGHTNAPQTLAKIYGLSFNDAIPSIIKTSHSDAIKVMGGEGKITVFLDPSFVGNAIHIYDISGSLLHSKEINNITESYSVNTKGMHFVKLINSGKTINTAKCIVK